MVEIEKLSCLVDLHCHLDGSISVENAKALAKMQNIDIPQNDAEIKALLMVDDDCRDLNMFLEKFDFPCSLLKTYDGLKLAIKNLLSELKEDGIMYAEIRFAPQLSVTQTFSQEDAVRAAIDGISESELKASLILCTMRGDNNRDENIETVNEASKYLNKGVCAIDLAGAEGLFSTDNFDYVFKMARELNIPFTIHAGEAAGAESVECALDFGAARIGHGVRSIEDENLINRLRDNNIPLEVCITSNILTCIYEKPSDHPFRKMMEMGIIVTINTDDMAVCNTNIRKEFDTAIDTFKLSDEEIKKIIVNSVEASFANENIKKQLIEKVNNEFASLIV